MKQKPIIKPFKGIHYNPSLLNNLRILVCPPYDIIKKNQEYKLKKSSRYNFCHLLLTDERNSYKKIGQRFKDWIKKGILIEDSQKAFYLCRQQFSFQGKTMQRYGFLGLLKLDKSRILPHEHTHRGPKIDRFSIISEVQANLSPIFITYPDSEKSAIEKIFKTDDHCEELAYHFENAGIIQKAIKYLIKAGDNAKAKYFYKNKYTRPNINSEKRIKLFEFFHPF